MNTNQEIKNYVSQKSNAGALLVTGGWGCGKTYLIHQVINELNEEQERGKECVAVLISLFGIDSIELLHQEIKNKVFFSRGFEKAQKKSKHIVSRVKNFSVNATDILGETFSIAKSINKALTIRWQYYFNVEKDIYCYSTESKAKNHLVKKKLVLFFDDFERSKLDRIELMGVINEYSENRGIKVIVIADEDKIIDKEKETPSDKDVKSKDNEYKYSEFKEKLISRTIKIKIDYKSTINSIITSYEETVDGYRRFLLDNEDLIYNVFIESETDNFRSVKAFVTDYERVYEALKGLNVSSEIETKLFYHFAVMLLGFKSGIYNEGEYGFIFATKKVKEMFSNWSSTYELTAFQNWIVKGIWNEENFINEVSEKFTPNKLTVGEKFIIYNIWDLSQTEIEEGIPEVVEKAYKGELTRDQLINLLQKVHYLNECSVPLPCNIDYLKIQNGFEIRKNRILNFEIEEPKRRTFSEKHQIDKEAYILYEDIEKFDKKLYVLESRKNLIDYLKLKNNINTYDFRYKLIGCFDTELLDLFFNRYLESNNSQKRNMCFTLLGIGFCDNHYLNEYEVKESIENFEKLKTKIQNSEQNKNDYITAIINKKFCDEIDNKIAEMKEYYKLPE